MTNLKRIRVLIIDDSAIFRQLLREGLSKDPEIEVVAQAIDPFDARDKIVEFRPDVLTLDVEMPRMDGVQFLRKLMPQYPIPTVMVSSLTQRGKEVTIAALEAGAIDFVTKPLAHTPDGVNLFLRALHEKVKIAAASNVSHWKGKDVTQTKKPSAAHYSLSFKAGSFIAVGASTGGTEALRSIIKVLPANTPGMLVVQHMPAGFTKMYADGLNDGCEMEVIEGKTGDTIQQGRVIIAPGGTQMTVKKGPGENWHVICEPSEKVNGHMPSVDVLFQSIAKERAPVAVGIILTGMGKDGAQGMLEMKQAGVYNIGQDEASSVVYGMPKAAKDLGALNEQASLHDIVPLLLKKLRI